MRDLNFPSAAKILKHERTFFKNKFDHVLHGGGDSNNEEIEMDFDLLTIFRNISSSRKKREKYE